jgi:4-hydroxybenzoyl-CoA thioesterase
MTTEIEVRFGDCDPAGIVFYGNFFSWYDHALWSAFAARGFLRAGLRERYGVVGWPLISTESRFLAPTREGDRLLVVPRIARWGRTSFEVAHRVTRGDTPIAEGFERRVWAGTRPDGTLDPKPIPEEVKAAFAT